ncbi:MAG: LysE family transporter [Planctomycetota bacterium]|jgi:threonine/homoserine/homoserine lactone efflux protein
MSLLLFLFEVVIISLSGVMAPGPVTAAAVAMGARSRHAGVLIAIGHGIIEFPLMILIMLGMDKVLKSTSTQIVIGLAGGTFLLIMAIQMLRSLKGAENQEAKTTKSGPVVAGIILSAGNPYFLLWWSTVGLTLATNATQLGIWAFALFAIVHWLCDLVWLAALSWASFKGSVLLGARSQRIVLMICSAALLVFGLFFIYNAGSTLIRLMLTTN